MVLTWRTDLATRSGRGRIFVPSPLGSATLESPDKWDPEAQYWIHAGTFGDNFTSPFTFNYGVLLESATLTGRVWSRVNDEGHDVTSFIRRTRPHWLRSRSTAP